MALSETTSSDIEKSANEDALPYSPSEKDGEVMSTWRVFVADLKKTFSTKEGWIGDYVCASKLAPADLIDT